MIKASSFSLKSGHKLLDNLEKIQFSETNDSGKPKLSFMSGDPTTFGNESLHLPEQAYDIVKQQLSQNKMHGYSCSFGSVESRMTVAQKFGNALTTEKDVIVVANVQMGLLNILFVSVNAGDNILTPDPGFPFYDKICDAFGIQVKKYNLIPEKNFEIDLEQLETLVDKNTKFIFVVNPSNPCGSVFSLEHQQKVLDFVRKKGIFLVSDEVYWENSFKSHPFHSFSRVYDDVPVVVCSGMEKLYLVPGWGVSWMIFSDKHKRLDKLKDACIKYQQVFIHPTTFVMGSVPEIVNLCGSDFIKRFVDEFEQKHDFLLNELKKIEGLIPIQAQGTFYLAVLIDLRRFPQFKNDIDFLQELNKQQNTQLLCLSAFSDTLQGFRLVTCATNEMNRDLVVRLTEFCQKNRA